MAGVKLSPEELEGATEIAPVKLSPEEMAGATPVDAPAPEGPGFFRRGIESIKSGAHDVANVAADAGNRMIEAVKDPLHLHPMAPEQRREFERGLDSMVTLGYGAKIARRAEETSFGRAMNRALGANADAPASMSAEQEAADAVAAPGYRTVGGAAGLFTPGAATTIAKGAGRLVKPIAGAVGEGAAALATRAGQVPLVGRALAPLVKGAGGAAEGAIGYEAAAPAISAASADAEGQRGEAALAAATDPSGLILSGGAGAAPHVAGPLARKAGNAAKKFIDEAPRKVDEWLVSDIRGQAARAQSKTAEKYLAADEADVISTLNRDPKLQDAVRDARNGDRHKLEKASTALKAKIAEVNAPRSELYDKDVDGALGGGVRSGDFVKQVRDLAEERRADGTDSGHKMANYLDAKAEQLERSRDWGYEAKPELDAKARGEIRDLQTSRDNLVKRPGSEAVIKQLDDQIKSIEDNAPKSKSFNPDTVVPTRAVRKWVTDLQDAAYDGLGGLSDTRAAGLSRTIAGDAFEALNVHLDKAAQTVPDAVAQIRDINTQHSALKNVERVIDERLISAKKTAEGGHAHAPHNIMQAAKSMGPIATGAAFAATGHPIVGAAIAAPAVAAHAHRFAGTQAARLAKSPTYAAAVDRMARAARKATSLADFTRDAAAAGFPIADAHQIYRAAHPDKKREAVAEARQ